jgi:methionine-rich copper-binding protein CopC
MTTGGFKMRARVMTLLTMTGAVLAMTTLLHAHMKASKFEPAANGTVTTSPRQVQVWFTQAPDPKVSKLEIAGPSGAVKLSGFEVKPDRSITAKVDDSLADGRYTVKWQAAGDDGHVQRGEFAFTVRLAR